MLQRAAVGTTCRCGHIDTMMWIDIIIDINIIIILVLYFNTMHGRRKIFSLMGAEQNLPDAIAVFSQIECPHRANFMGAAAPISRHGSYAYAMLGRDFR